MYSSGRGLGPPAALFQIAGLRDVLDGLWVRRSGRSFLTRIKTPNGYHEVALADDAFSVNYRVAVASSSSEPAARELLTPTFTEWYCAHVEPSNALSQAGSFELAGGVLFIRGASDCFNNSEKLDAFTVSVSGLADKVSDFVSRSPSGAN